MLSRIADSLFWLNRYMERADGMLRLAGTHYIFSLDKDVSGTSSWKPVMEIFTESEEDYLNSIENNTEECLKTFVARYCKYELPENPGKQGQGKRPGSPGSYYQRSLGRSESDVSPHKSARPET